MKKSINARANVANINTASIILTVLSDNRPEVFSILPLFCFIVKYTPNKIPTTSKAIDKNKQRIKTFRLVSMKKYKPTKPEIAIPHKPKKAPINIPSRP